MGRIHGGLRVNAVESLSLVACPHGVDERRRSARLSLLVVPRLSGAARLGDYPNLGNWPGTLQRGPVEATLSWAGGSITVPVPTGGLRHDLWPAILPDGAPVVDHTFDDHSGRLVVSYPAMLAAAVVKSTYQEMALTSAAELPSAVVVRRMTEELQTGWGGSQSKVRDAVRRALWESQNGQGTMRMAVAASADGGITTLPAGVNTGDVAARVALFHNPPQGEPPHLDPDTVLDVHRAISALAAHPALMRALGLVLDVTIPLDRVGGATPQPGNPYPTVAVEKLTASWEGDAPAVHGPPTAFRLVLAGPDRTPVTFEAAPAAIMADVPDAGPVAGGMLLLPGELFGLLALDVDGAMHKVAAAAMGAHRPTGRAGLPALRSAGLSLVASDRGEELVSRIARAKQLNDSLTNPGALQSPLTAADLVRGYRFDVWSSDDATWRSLHRRTGVYRTGAKASLPVEDDEGFSQLGATSAAGRDAVPQGGGPPPPETDLRVHERMARWSGWSLSVRRPGKALNRSADPGQSLDDDPSMDDSLTPFKLTTDFSVVRGSLPKLRFGRRYRMRARVVDVAGNSVPPDTAEVAGTALPADPAGFAYLRHEPVPAPVVVATSADFGTGGDLHRLVIRSRNADPSQDAVPTTEEDARHIAPPRTSIRMAEHHGALDGVADSYAVVQRDAVAPPATEPSVQMEVGYVPDPLSRGAALRGLPGAAGATLADTATHLLDFRDEPDVDASGPPTAVIRFGNAWPDLEPFRLRIAEGDGPPQWDDTGRQLTVWLPKAASASVPLSSVVRPEDLALLEPWRWIREAVEKAEGDELRPGGGSASSLVGLGAGIARLVRAALRGGLWMLTPSREITLVHAVQQPLRAPEFVSLQLTSAIAGFDTEPDPLTGRGATLNALLAERDPGSTSALLLGGMRVHGASTAKIDIDATWSDIVDDPSQRYPWTRSTSAHVEEVALHELSDHAIAADGAQSRYVGIYVASHDLVCFLDAAGRVGRFSGSSVAQSGDAAPLHRIGDTRHHRVTYRATATTRFREFFEAPAAPAPGAPPPDDTPYVRAGEPVIVEVPSSARPHAPAVLDVLPTFGWDRQLTTDVRASVRRGRGLRVYLQRPWFSSGDGELLGVVLWDRDTPPSDGERHAVAPFVTQWGADPIWTGRPVSAMPTVLDFEDAVTADGLSVPRLDASVGVAGFPVEFDPDRGLWFADVVFSTSQAYSPMVRLALARYQPHSISGAELSPVVLADVAQFLPDRSVVVTTDPQHPETARVVVSGVAPDGPRQNIVELTVQQRRSDFGGELAWEDVPNGTVQVLEMPAALTGAGALWAGALHFGSPPPPDTYRLLVREYENLPVDPPPLLIAGAAAQRTAQRDWVGRRVVFAEHVPLGPPSAAAALH